MDRPGSNLRSFDLPAADPGLCKTVCDGDPACKAYTYVSPGYQGANARCWLKNDTPAPVPNACCISGVRYKPGCMDWSQAPPGIVVGLKQSVNLSSIYLTWGGTKYYPDSGQNPPAGMVRQTGGDLGGSAGQGFYWYETSGSGFRFPSDAATWQALQSRLPSGLVQGLKHSTNQRDKGLLWVAAAGGAPRLFNPTRDDPSLSPILGRQNGGDRGGSEGEGFYWYEVNPQLAQYQNCDDEAMPGGLIFGLKHSMNRANRKFSWRGQVYDAAQRGGPIPPGFARCHGGDLGAPSGQGYFWFETLGNSSSLQVLSTSSCEYQYLPSSTFDPNTPGFDPRALPGTSRVGGGGASSGGSGTAGTPCKMHPPECNSRGVNWQVTGMLVNGRCIATPGKDYCTMCGGACGGCFGESCSSSALCSPGSTCVNWRDSINAPARWECRLVVPGCTPLPQACWTKDEVGKPQVGCVEGQK